MTEEQVLRTLEDGVLTLLFNRPDKKNAITDAMYGTLADGLAEADADPAVRVVLFRGEGGAFTAGNDISSFAAQNAAGAASKPEGERNVMRFIRALARARKPLVAAVTGPAIGVGLTMLLHCDLVFVATDARLSAPFVNLALVPEAASSLLLGARIGHVRAFSMFALGQVLTGAEAQAWGLANEALPAAEVGPAARKAAEALASRPLQSLIATKGLMRNKEMLLAQIDHEQVQFIERLASAEAREAFAAFAERRAQISGSSPSNK
jgi:enoyl-CoA hydratase/carnithine racemase